MDDVANTRDVNIPQTVIQINWRQIINVSYVPCNINLQNTID